MEVGMLNPVSAMSPVKVGRFSNMSPRTKVVLATTGGVVVGLGVGVGVGYFAKTITLDKRVKAFQKEIKAKDKLAKAEAWKKRQEESTIFNATHAADGTPLGNVVGR